jgi:tetratricopeptide (TPR) repeat protein
LTEAVALQDPKACEADVELGTLYMQLGMHEKALVHLDHAIAGDPQPGIRKQRIECLLRLKRFDEAESLLSDVIRSSGEDVITTMLVASIAEARGDELAAKDMAAADRKYAEQREALARAEAHDPGNPKPRILLAQSLVNEYRRTQRAVLLDDALVALDRAESIRPGTPEVAVVRVNILREKNDLNGAIGELRRFLDRNPDHIGARRELVQLHLARKDPDAAIAVVDEAISVNPTMALWHDARGDLLAFTKGDKKAALESYYEADRLAPTTNSLRKIVETTLAMPAPDWEDLVARLEARPNELHAMPFLRESMAKAMHRAGRREDAIENARLSYARRKELMAAGIAKPVDIAPWFQVLIILFERTDVPGQLDCEAAHKLVMELCNNQPDVFELASLSKTWLLAGDPTLARSIELQKQAVAACPPDDVTLLAEIHVDLANLHLLARNPAEAARIYETALTLSPDNVEALNNLAFITAEDLKDPAKALPYAQRALDKAPQSGSVHDTYGWVHFLAGNLDTAEKHLAESLRLDDRQAGTWVHAAEIHLRKNDLDNAQRCLDQAEKRNPDGTTRLRIEQLKDDIRKKRTPGG